jgi:hypothetical protein
MRKAMLGIALIVLAGCGGEPPVPQGPVSCEVLPGLTLQLPAGWKLSNREGRVDLKPAVEHCHIQVWAAEGAAPADVLPKVADLVKAEVKDFKADETKDLNIAGSAAKHLVGGGIEADDNDKSKVEVFVFSAGGKVFVLCAHTGEDDPAKQRDEIVKLLGTAKAK